MGQFESVEQPVCYIQNYQERALLEGRQFNQFVQNEFIQNKFIQSEFDELLQQEEREQEQVNKFYPLLVQSVLPRGHKYLVEYHFQKSHPNPIHKVMHKQVDKTYLDVRDKLVIAQMTGISTQFVRFFSAFRVKVVSLRISVLKAEGVVYFRQVKWIQLEKCKLLQTLC